MIASLPMYDRPETAAANDRLWSGTRRNLGFGPKQLARDGDVWGHWRNPELVLSQTCGMPYRNYLHGKVQLVGTPDYGVCDRAGYYHSVFITRKTEKGALAEFAERIFAYNEKGSQSGWAAPQCHVAELGFQFRNTVETGGHAFSALAVAKGSADLASLDAVTWQLIRDDAALADLKVIAETEPTPGLPLITAQGMDAVLIFDAVAAAIDALPTDDKHTLHLKGICRIEAETYLAIPNPPA